MRVVLITGISGSGKSIAINVLEDDDVRQAVKDYSKWPTVPQLYLGGEFIGGSDIIAEMYEKGELMPLVKEAAAKSA